MIIECNRILYQILSCQNPQLLYGHVTAQLKQGNFGASVFAASESKSPQRNKKKGRKAG